MRLFFPLSRALSVVLAGACLASPVEAKWSLPAGSSDPQPAAKVPLKKEMRGVHPRLLFSKEDIPAMKAWIKTPEGKASFEKLKGYLGASKPPKHTKFQKDATDGQRQGLWRAPAVGMHYVLTGDQASKQKALGFMKVFLENDNWEKGGEQDAGMSSANIAIGAALLYDWLYHDLDPDFRTQYRDKLLLMARRQFHGGHLNKNKSTAYWQGDPANNHRWHRNAGMGLMALAAAEEDKADDEWIIAMLKKDLDYVHKWLPVDGTTHEGPGYMIFGLAHLMLGAQSADRVLGTNYLAHPFYKTVPTYMIASLLPGFKGMLAYGDCGIGSTMGNYTNVLYLCAAVNKQGDVINGLKKVEATAPKSFWVGWFDFVWKRPAMAYKGDYKNIPLATFFPDMGVLDIRDKWESDGVAAMFKSSPPGGYGLNEYRNTNNFKYINVAHDDPDANSFIIFNNGKMTADTDAYSARKRSSNHNTILVNDHGQLVKGRMTEDTVWWQPGNGDMTKLGVVTTLKQTPAVTFIEGEAAQSYPAVTKVNKKIKKTRPALSQYRRSFVWVKGKYVLVLDSIKAQGSAKISWLMQSRKVDTLDTEKGLYKLVNGSASCEFQVVSTAEVTGEVVDSTADNKKKPLGLKQLRLHANTQAVRFASAYDPWQQGKVRVAIEVKDDKQAIVTVTGNGINDTWTWNTPAGEFTPSVVTGNVGGKTFEVKESDVAPTAH